MPDLPSSSSFIPKRTAGVSARQKRTHSFFFLSVISYACLIAAPTASAAVYVYQLYTHRQFEQVVSSLETSMDTFSDAEMERVLEFDRRLKLAQSLVESHVSVVRVLEALEANTVAEAGFTNLSIVRNEDGSLAANADMLATNLDTAIFQRTTYNNENIAIDDASLGKITFAPAGEDGGGQRVTMTGTFGFTVDDIRFEVKETVTDVVGDTDTTPAESTSGDAATSTGSVTNDTL